jgi:zinc transporter, ZIP family
MLTDPILAALAATGLSWFSTTVGAGGVFVSGRPSVRVTGLLLGFAAGMMLAVSFLSLLPDALHEAQVLGQPPWGIAICGFICGIAALAALNRFAPHAHPHEPAQRPDGPRSTLPVAVLIALALTIHNIPEGLAVGITAAAAAMDGHPQSATALTLGIAVHNAVEGLLVAYPLLAAGMGRGKAFLIGAGSGLVEPLAGVLGALFITKIAPAVPFALALAAGAMAFVSIEELIPEALRAGSHRASLAVMSGMITLMLLSALL